MKTYFTFLERNKLFTFVRAEHLADVRAPYRQHGDTAAHRG